MATKNWTVITGSSNYDVEADYFNEKGSFVIFSNNVGMGSEDVFAVPTAAVRRIERTNEK